MNIDIKCPCCASEQTQLFLERKAVPVHQNMILKKKKEAARITRGDLKMGVCKACGFVFNKAFDPDKMAYGQTYDNLQTCSSLFSDYVDGLAHSIVHDAGVQNCRIVEVGCGKGFFLEKLLTIKGGEANKGYGFDPSYEGQDTDLDGRLRFFKQYYTPKSTHINADAVVCRHVIEHDPSPVELLKSIRATLSNSPDAKVFFETPCAEWILKNGTIWDFFYEHCSLFTKESLNSAFEIAGFTVTKVNHVFHGQYLWLEARPYRDKPPKTFSAGPIPDLAANFSNQEASFKTRWIKKANRLKASGKTAIWGAGAKGVTFASLIDPQTKLIDCVIDINPNKQNGFIPGTGHPILGPNQLKNRGIKHIILMNPNYKDEVLEYLNQGLMNINLILAEVIDHETDN